MDFLELIRKRRSIRKFSSAPVADEKIEALVEAALRAPSSKSRNPWSFCVVTDRAKLDRLAASKPHGASFLTNAPLAMVVCADPKLCDVWIEDCSIASTFVFLAAEALGLGACWIQIRKRDHSEHKSATQAVLEILDLPSHLEVESIIAIGHSAESKPPHDQSELPCDKVIGWGRRSSG